MDVQEILRRLRAIDDAGNGCDELDDLIRELEAMPKMIVHAVSDGQEVRALFRDRAPAASMRDLMNKGLRRKSYRADRWLVPAWVFEFEG